MASASVFIVESTCDFDDNHTDLPVLVISFIFLVGFTLIFVFWFKGIKSRRSVGRFPVLAFTVGLAAAFINYSLLIASLFVLRCTVTNAVEDWDGLQVGSFIAKSIQNLINLGIVLIYIVPLATDLSWPYTFAHKIVLAIISAIFIPFVVINTLDNLGGYVLYSDVTVPSLNVDLNISAAYYFLLLCVATYCVCVLIFYQFKRRTDDNPRKITDWVVVAVLFLFVGRLLDVIYDFAWFLPNTLRLPKNRRGYLENYPIHLIYVPPGAVIAFHLMTPLASAASYLGIAKMRF